MKGGKGEAPRGRQRRRHQERHPDTALSFLRNYVNNKNLAELLRICASLSCYEEFSPFTEPWALKRYVNYPHNRALIFAVLESKSHFGAAGHVSSRDLVLMLNNARDASYDPHALDAAKSLSGRPGVELEVHRFFARMGNIQIAHQEHNPIVSAGRTVAMLEVMPVSKEEWLSREAVGTVRALAPEFCRILGANIKDLARAHALIWLFCQHNFDEIVNNLPPKDVPFTENQLLSVLLEVVLAWAYTDRPLSFSAAEISERSEGEATEMQIENLLKIFSRQWSVLRSLMKLPAYQVGHIASRLCPLERYPIVEIGNSARHIIPNSTIFSKSFSQVIDYTLFEELQKIGLGSDYSSFRGFMQEVYIRSLVEDCLSTCICVPERQYGKEHRRGPDLTVIDTRRSRLIVIESKSRRMRADTVALMSDEAIAENLEDAFEALLEGSQED